MKGDIVAEVVDVRCRHRRGSEDVHSLDGVSFAVHAGELVVLHGPSGSGKTSLLHVLCGWEQPDHGSVRWADGVHGEGWAGLAVVPQALGLLDELTVRENVELPARVGKVGHHEWPQRFLDALALSHLADRLVDEVSMGERQRAAVARAVLLRPRLLLADEPTSHQDHDRARFVLDQLREAALLGSAVVVASHDPATLAAAHRVVAMRDGRLVSAP